MNSKSVNMVFRMQKSGVGVIAFAVFIMLALILLVPVQAKATEGEPLKQVTVVAQRGSVTESIFSGMSSDTTLNVVQGGGLSIQTHWDADTPIKEITVHARSLAGSGYIETTSRIDGASWSGTSSVSKWIDVYNGSFGCAAAAAQLPWDAVTGKWIIDKVTALGMNGVSYTYNAQQQADGDYILYDGATTLKTPGFTVVSTQEDEVAPVLTSFSIGNSKSTAQRPGVLELHMGVLEEGTGVVGIDVNGFVTGGSNSAFWQSFSPESYEFDEYGNQKPWKPYYSGNHTLHVAIPSEAYTGIWGLNITLRDRAGNSTSYYSSYVLDSNGVGIGHSSQCKSNGGTGNLVLDLPGFRIVDEFDYAFTMGLSNPLLLSRIQSMADGKYARVKIESGGVLPAAIFDAIRGTNKAVVCYDDAVQWVFRGKDIVNVSKDVNLNVNIGMMETEELQGATKQAVYLQFASNGVLPGKAQVRFKNDYLYQFRDIKGTLNLYYINSGELDLEDTVFDMTFDGTDKWCYVDIKHNSKFIVTPDKVTKLTETTLLKDATVSLGRSQDWLDHHWLDGHRIEVFVTYGDGGTHAWPKSGASRTVVDSKTGSSAKFVFVVTGDKVGPAKLVTTITTKRGGAKTITKKFSILPVKTSLSKVKPGKKSVKVTWKKLTKKAAAQQTGFQVRWSYKKSMKSAKTITVKGVGKKTATIKKLKKGKKVYVQVRTYKTVKGKKYCSEWSKAKHGKIR